MDRVSQIYGIEEGLGDCLVAAASCQKLSRLTNKKIKFHTSKLLNCLFEGHPNIEIVDSDPTFKFKWPSQIDKSYFGLHTMQRFAQQIGLILDPIDVLHVYRNNCRVINNPEKLVLINDSSAEPMRRYLPIHIVERVANYANHKGYEVLFIGNSSYVKNSIMDIKECVNLLSRAKLFVGPVSFQYHLASAINTRCLLFTSYMPAYKYSHFFNTTSISSKKSCSFVCEEFEAKIRSEVKCFHSCFAVDYDLDEIDLALKSLL